MVCGSKLGIKEVDPVAFWVGYDGELFNDWRSSGNGPCDSEEKPVLGELCWRDVGMARALGGLYVFGPRNVEDFYTNS